MRITNNMIVQSQFDAMQTNIGALNRASQVATTGKRILQASDDPNASTQVMASNTTLRALDQYNTNLASQEYNNWFNQQASLAGIGQASAQNLGALGQNNANMASNILQNQGNARASGILGQTDAYVNGLNQVGQWYGNYRRSRQGAY